MSEQQNFNSADEQRTLPTYAEVGESLGVIESMNFYDPIQTDSLMLSGKHEQAALVRTIGERLRQARELSCLSQSEAARRFGYSNPSKLSKVESATDTNSVPLWLVCAAAKVYEVSVDYLFGIVNDWETGVCRGAQHWMLDAWQKMRERDMSALDRVHVEVTTVATTTSDLIGAVSGLSGAVSAFQTLNEEWEDMRGGATLVARLARLEVIARDAEAKLRKLRLTPKEAA